MVVNFCEQVVETHVDVNELDHQPSLGHVENILGHCYFVKEHVVVDEEHYAVDVVEGHFVAVVVEGHFVAVDVEEHSDEDAVHVVERQLATEHEAVVHVVDVHESVITSLH